MPCQHDCVRQNVRCERSLPGSYYRFDWNPLFHSIDHTLVYVFINFNPHYTSISYPVKCLLFTDHGRPYAGILHPQERILSSWDAVVKCLVTAFFLHAIQDACESAILAGTLHGQMWQ
jgi:hypothetical protein